MVIPIVLAANDEYAPMIGVTMQSVLANANIDDTYHFYIFHTDISKMHQLRLSHMQTEHALIKFMNLTANMKGIRRERSNHLSIETVYRLFIPELLGQYEKIIYIDCDLVVNADIAELYKQDIGDYIFGAAPDVYTKEAKDHFEDVLNVPSEIGFNAGVLLINVPRFCQENVKEKCFALLREDWERLERKFIYMDQDVLNIVCQGKVKLFSMEWDFQWGCAKGYDIEPEGIYAEEYLKAQSNIKILHFSGEDKPWAYPEFNGSEYFWKYARQTVFYEELLRKIHPMDRERELILGKLKFPYDVVGRNSEVVLYGAGFVGSILKKQNEIKKYCKIILWVDKKYSKIEAEKGLDVYSPLEICQTNFDYVVIAVEKERMADQIKEELKKLGVPEEKIIWKDYFGNKRGSQK